MYSLISFPPLDSFILMKWTVHSSACVYCSFNNMLGRNVYCNSKHVQLTRILCVCTDSFQGMTDGMFIFEDLSLEDSKNVQGYDAIVVEQWTVLEVSVPFGF